MWSCDEALLRTFQNHYFVLQLYQEGELSMANQSRNLSSEHHDADKRVSWNAIFVTIVLLAILTLWASLGFSFGVLNASNSMSEATVLSGAGTSAALWTFVAMVLGCCVCARRNCGRNERSQCQKSALSSISVPIPPPSCAGELSDRLVDACARSNTKKAA